MEQLLLNIAEQGALVALLVAVIIYFLRRESKKDDEIAKLNQELRDTEKEHLVLMNKLLVYLDKIDDKIDDIKNGK